MDEDVQRGWRKSTHSIANGECAEAASGSGRVLVRDSTDTGGAVLEFPAGAWTEFLGRQAAVRRQR